MAAWDKDLDPAAPAWERDLDPIDASPQSIGQRVKQGAGNVLAGAVRGAGSIGATLLAPVDAAARAVGVENSVIGRRDRREAMDDALRGLGADTDSLGYGAGKLGAEIAGTAGVGGAVVNTVARSPGLAARAPSLLDAVRTSGFSAGGLTGRAGLGARAAGGAVAGGASAGLVNPDDAAVGAGIGAALPGVVQAAGRAGSAIGSTFRSPQAKAGSDLIRALDLRTPQAIDSAIAQLTAARELVPGSTPTAAQALRTPQAGILQRVVADSAGGRGLRDQLAAQNAARLAAVEGVAPTAPTGYAAARQDFGEALARSAQAGDAAARARTSALYDQVPQDEAALYLPDLAASRDKFFGAGSFVDRAPADRAVSVAQQLSAPPRAMAQAQVPQTLASAVRKAGGVRAAGDLTGEARAIDAKNMLRRDGMTLDDMAEAMHQRGLIGDESPDALLEALRAEAMGGRGLAGERVWEAQRQAAMGDPTARKVTLREFDNLRKSIGIEQRAAAKADNDTLAASLKAMKDQLDDRINQVVRGDGAVDENLPTAWADALDAARKSKIDQVQRFRTGPQAALFGTGSDGQPVVQGGEVAAKFWGQRPGIADDVKSLRRLIGDNDKLLGQFRSMVTTEGAATQAAGGQLGAKFVRWVDNSLPGLKETFEPAQVRMLQRVAADIRRAEAAASAGMSRGSNTYQNAQNALELGLLDSPLLNMAANRVPLLSSVSGPALTYVRDTARAAKARRLGDLLGDAGATADALRLGTNRPSVRLGELQQMLYRSAPVAAADR